MNAVTDYRGTALTDVNGNRWKVHAGAYSEDFADYYAAEEYAVQLSYRSIQSDIKAYRHDACHDCATNSGSCRLVCPWSVPISA